MRETCPSTRQHAPTELDSGGLTHRIVQASSSIHTRPPKAGRARTGAQAQFVEFDFHFKGVLSALCILVKAREGAAG